MAKLNQIIAVEKGIKSRIYSKIGELHKILQKPALFNGFDKSYQPKEEGGTQLPPEKQKIQFTVKDILRTVEELSGEYFDIVARKDWTNGNAKANIEVDGVRILKDVPVTYLLFLEKQLSDIRAIAADLPVLASEENWLRDETADLYKTEVVKTHRTEKKQEPIVLYHATVEHAAQTQIITSDQLVGHWHLTKHSCAIPKGEREKYISRVDKLLIAVKQAREAANGIDETSSPHVGEAIFSYLLK
jgi:hypothetical protein